MKQFEELIKPEPIESFFEKYWTRNELHLSNHFNASALFNIEKLNDLINTNQDHLSFPVIRLIKNGKIISESRYTELTTKRRQATSRQISISKLVEFCNSGATMTFNGLNNYSVELSDYCKKISTELNEATQINCYLTQKGNQGFEPHFDHHEIFIIQVQGEKEWDLFGKAEAFPIPTSQYYDQGKPDFENKRSYQLASGDVLYIPRGMWHQAKTINSSSLHLTLNVMCDLKIDFLHWLLDHIANHDAKFRENLFRLPAFESGNVVKFAVEYLQSEEGKYSQLIKQYRNEKQKSEKTKIPFTT